MFRTITRPTKRAALAVGCTAVLGLGLASTAPASAAPAVDPNGRHTAQEIHTFLEDFYGESGPGDFARKYGISEHLKEKVAANEGFDVLMCAENEEITPWFVSVGPVSTAQSAGVGYATVTTYWDDLGEDTATFTAYVGLDATRPIQLQDTDCEASG